MSTLILKGFQKLVQVLQLLARKVNLVYRISTQKKVRRQEDDAGPNKRA